jgi:hypothetical protein
MRMTTILTGVAVLVISGGSVLAQTKDKASPKPRSEASVECSKQADAQGLKGKKRKTFRATCKKNYKKAA